jgi:hypothetical protein
LHERYQASRKSEQRGENNNDVDDDKSMSYLYLNTALWFAQINDEKIMVIEEYNKHFLWNVRFRKNTHFIKIYIKVFNNFPTNTKNLSYSKQQFGTFF